jgi:putative SOS response-associated peptidase YedK
MCGRFFLEASLEELTELLGPFEGLPPSPRYNIAPTQPVSILRADATGGRHLVPVRWGLVPSWSQGPDQRYSMINARAETVAVKPAFRAAMRYRRCLVPASGFYEWQPAAGGKQPFAIRRPDQKPFAIAGLWELWQAPDGSELESCTLLVTEANARIAQIHDRMPVILDPVDFATWLDRHRQHPDDLLGLLRACPEEWLEVYPVSKAVNNPRSDAPELLDVVARPPPSP